MGRETDPPRPQGGLLVACLPLLLIAAWWLRDSLAYVQIIDKSSGAGIFWPTSQATLNLRVGCPPNRNLSAWGPCWDDAAQDAAAQWNAAGAQFTFRIQSPSRPAAPSCDRSDGINTVVWEDTICGVAFDNDALAVTKSWFRSTGELVDSDVLFNTAYSWTTYAGPWRSGLHDFHRVALHEFGHVLGLDHPDEYGQSVNAIMNSRSDNIDRLQADDINGIKAIYGSTSTRPTRKGLLENPGQGAFKSGIGVISGWVCQAQRVEVEINGSRMTAAYGTERLDTRERCGDTNNGFAILYNWNRLGDGTHTARLLVDGTELDRSTFRVTTFGQEFLQGATGRYTLFDFPRAGTNTVVEWEQNSQNFVIREVE